MTKIGFSSLLARRIATALSRAGAAARLHVAACRRRGPVLHSMISALERRLFRTTAATMLVGLVSLVAATGASAHSAWTSLYDSNGRLVGQGGVASSHHHGYACDYAADAKEVFIRWETRSGYRGGVDDSNGSAAGCGSSYWMYTIYRFQVCVDNALSHERCSRWKLA
jgi:hypothetical protein